MRKLIVTCECGARVQAPLSAMGRTGQCPTCGRKMVISPSNTGSAQTPRTSRLPARTAWQGSTERPREARVKFAQAVDFYLNRRYAEALTLFTSLCEQFPGDADIRECRARCINALKTGTAPALEDRSQRPASQAAANAELTEDAVKHIVLDKMLHGLTEDVQLRAADLASRILGMIERPKDASRPPEEPRAQGPSAPADSSSVTHEEPQVPVDWNSLL